MSPAVTTDICRVTVIGPRQRADIALPTQVPFAALFRTIADFCGVNQEALAREPGGWVLQRLGQPPFKMSSTPADMGLYDGELIYLRPKAQEMPPMASDDIADEIASVHDGPGRWAPTDAQHLSVGAAAVGLAAGAILLARSGPHWTLAAAAAGVIALVLVIGAVAASRALGNTIVATLLGCTALPYAFVAGVAAVSNNSPGTFVHGTAMGALTGFALVVAAAVVSAVGVARGVPVFFGLALAGLFGAGAAVITIVDPNVPAAGAGALVTIPALALSPFLSGIAFRLAGLAMPRVPASADDLRNDALLAPQNDVKSRAVVADHVVTGAVAGIALICAGAEVALGFGHGLWTVITAVVLPCAMLLQSRLFRGRAQRLWLLGLGYAGLAWMAIAFGHVYTTIAVVILAGLVAAVGSWLPSHRPSPVWGRAADIADYVLIVAMIPLALEVADVLTYLHGLRG